jgi:hypothetical protein
VVGIFSFSDDTLSLLTNYYLGNEFISFSPSGKYFVYQGNCREAMCGLFIQESSTLHHMIDINNPVFVDERMSNAVFVQWISDNEVEYRLHSIADDTITTEKEKFL